MSSVKVKKRLDLFVQEQRPHVSRSSIQEIIKKGYVSVGGLIITKPGFFVNENDAVIIACEDPAYVSRSGFKLEQALQEFQIDVTGLVALDVGLSTGGFTDCLLQHGIQKVYGVDVGTDQVHQEIAQNARVVVMEKTDIRNCIGKIPVVDLVVVDVSFISVLKIMSAVSSFLSAGGKLIILIKPQFETEQKMIARGGIVKDTQLRDAIKDRVVEQIAMQGFAVQGVVASATVGGDGNIEYLAYFIKL